MLINCSPQPMAFDTDLQQYPVQMPLVAGSSSSSTQPSRVAAPNLAHHRRIDSWLTMMARSARRSCTSRKLRWNLKYSHTASARSDRRAPVRGRE
jgi:hypothetical protein